MEQGRGCGQGSMVSARCSLKKCSALALSPAGAPMRSSGSRDGALQAAARGGESRHARPDSATEANQRSRRYCHVLCTFFDAVLVSRLPFALIVTAAEACRPTNYVAHYPSMVHSSWGLQLLFATLRVVLQWLPRSSTRRIFSFRSDPRSCASPMQLPRVLTGWI